MTPPQYDLRAAFYTLGCKLNFSETSTIGKQLSERGIRRADSGEAPDIIVVNTCSVTEMADKKGRQLIRRLARQWPAATLIVTGCYAQLKPEEIASTEGVDIVLGSNEKLKIASFLDDWMAQRQSRVEVTPTKDIREFHISCERGDRTRYFLKVQDGCDYFCTYCTIPYARGRSRSGTISEIVAEARKVAAEGGKEIVITGVNTGDFGRNTGESFIDLLRALDDVEGIARYRISSIEPNLLTSEIINWVATESRAFMPHFHVPLQSGSDRVLKLMNRRYDTALFRGRMEEIREMLPEAFIGVDVIAGARGETPDEWECSKAFIADLPVSRLHVFPYSERPGTAALRLADSVPPEERHRRVAELMEISDAMLLRTVERNIGREAPVLWEQPPAGADTMHGLTDNYLRVTAPAGSQPVNEITRLPLTPENLRDQNF